MLDLGAAGVKLQDFDQFLDQIRSRFGFDHAAYVGCNPLADTIQAFATYSDDWKQFYRSRHLYMLDPTLAAAMRSIAPVDWARLERNETFHQIFRAASAFGIPAQGITIPVRGPYGDIGMLSLTRDCALGEWQRCLPAILPELQSLALHLHDGAMRRHNLTRLLHRPHLSPREAAILHQLALGKTSVEICHMMGIPTPMLRVHLRSCLAKLSALTPAQAVARARVMGLLHPP